MDCEKSINLFETKKDRAHVYSLHNYFIHEFIYNFSELILCKINGLDISVIVDSFQIF